MLGFDPEKMLIAVMRGLGIDAAAVQTYVNQWVRQANDAIQDFHVRMARIESAIDTNSDEVQQLRHEILLLLQKLDPDRAPETAIAGIILADPEGNRVNPPMIAAPEQREESNGEETEGTR